MSVVNPTSDGLTSRQSVSWVPALLLVAAVLLLFRDTAEAMVSIWIRSETFQHAFLVVPISAWLAWRRRASVAVQPVYPLPWMLVPIAALCLMWLMGELAEVDAASQLAMVGLIVMSVPALFGWHVARVLAFPLLFLFFAVPIGDFAVPTLQEWTADVTVAALRLTGVPVYREGMQFVIPTGVWSVVEACSGIRYIIACVMVGTLFAYLNYRSTRRRLLFTLAAVIVPIIANWVRAYTIVMIGHVTGSPMILGVEHTTYGWFLFGFVVLILFVVGARWSEDETQDTPAPVLKAPVLSPTRNRTTWAVAAAVLGLVSATHAVAGHLQQRNPLPPLQLALPEAHAGWTLDPSRTALDWPHGYVNPAVTMYRAFDGGTAPVELWVGYYRQQHRDHKLVTSMHRLVANERGWRAMHTGIVKPAPDLPAFDSSVVSLGNAPTLAESRRQRVWQVYWVNGRWLVDPRMVKLVQALDQLLGHGDDGAVVLLVTPQDENADTVLAQFARGHLDAVGAALASARVER